MEEGKKQLFYSNYLNPECPDDDVQYRYVAVLGRIVVILHCSVLRYDRD